MKVPENPSKIVDQMRAWFHPKDRPVFMDENAFIEGSNLSAAPTTYPNVDRSRVFFENDHWWSQDESGLIRPLDHKAPNISNYLALPGLRGLWTMGAFDSSGNTFDQSDNVRTLTYNGNPVYRYAGLVPYIALDGTGDYLSRASEAGLSITGTEAYVGTGFKGLTCTCWLYVASLPGALAGLINKSDVSTNRSYELVINPANTIGFRVSSVGTSATLVGVSSSNALVANNWHFIAGIHIPSTSLTVYVSNPGTGALISTMNTSSIPASIFSGTANFTIGAFSAGTSLLTGFISMASLYTMALSNDMIENLYLSDKAAYGIIG